MKILLIAKPWKGGLGRYFYLALQDMFPGSVEWISTRPRGLGEILRYRRDPSGWWRDLRDRIAARTYDAALFIGFRKEWRELRADARHVIYLVDAVSAKAGDLDGFGRIFLSDPGYASDLLYIIGREKYGGAVPFACHPFLHAPARYDGERKGVCFIGNRDAKRDPYLEALLAADLSSAIVGNYFMKSALFWRHPLAFRPPVANEAMGSVYARHAVALNIHAEVVREGTNMRSFECAGYGIPQVIEHRPGIEACFRPGEDMLYFRNAAEMIAQIRSLYDEPGRARVMASSAHARALAEHTYYHRIKTILAHLLPQAVLETAFARGMGRIRR